MDRIYNVTIFLSLFILIYSSPVTSFASQNKEVNSQKDLSDTFSTDPLSEYVSLKAKLLKKPSGITVEESFIKKMFGGDYKKYGLAFVKVTNVAENNLGISSEHQSFLMTIP